MAGYRDSFGFTGPLPLSSNQRRIPAAGFPTGPEVGAPLPDFALLDHCGRRVSFHADRGSAKAAVVFFRSAVWSPACLTQLGELQDALPRFDAAGIRLYAVSYDEREALADFARARGIRFPLLSDPESAVIRRFGILNTLLAPDDVPFYGIPFPGTYLVDEAGVVRAKFFARHMALRESADTLVDTLRGSVEFVDGEPRASGGDDDLRITAVLHGGGGVLKSGSLRRLIARLEVREGLALCAPPAPEGVPPFALTVDGPEGLHSEPPILPPTASCTPSDRDDALPAWRGRVDVAIPVWADSDLSSIFTTPSLARDRATLTVTVRCALCDAARVHEVQRETLSLEVPVGMLDVPNLPEIADIGHRVLAMDATSHFDRLVTRQTPPEAAG